MGKLTSTPYDVSAARVVVVVELATMAKKAALPLNDEDMVRCIPMMER
jgi:hypothetical protein